MQRSRLEFVLALSLAVSACGTRVDPPDTSQLSSPSAGGTTVAPAPVLPAAAPDSVLPLGAGSPRTGAQAAGAPTAGSTAGASPDPAARAGAQGQPVSTGAPHSASVEDTRSMVATPSQPTPGVSDSVPAPGGAQSAVVIGSLGTQSGIVGNQFVDGTRGLQTWVAWINDRGGVNGHPVRLVIADDGGDPARNRALAQQLVEERKAIAIVHETAPLSGHAAIAYLEQKQVPVIGTGGASAWVYDSPMFFPHMASSDAAGTGVLGSAAPLARAERHSKLGVVTCVEAQACKDIARGAADHAAQFGFEVVYRGEVSLSQPYYTAECIAARNAGVEVFFPAVDNNSLIRLARSCANIGFSPRYALPHSVLETVRGDPNLQGSTVSSPVKPWFINGHPAVDEYHAALARYAPKLPATVMSMAGWASGKLFEAATRRLPANPTAQDVLAGLWTLKGEDLGGLTYPLQFKPGAPATKRACWFPVRILDGKWVDASGQTVTCL